ncbi:MAG: hypothetical protein ACLR7U_04915 [Ruthenibacterium lactatiformans]
MPDTEAALAGARDILAEGFSDSANLRYAARPVQRNGTGGEQGREKRYRQRIFAITITASPPQKWRATAFWPWTEARGRAS